MTVPDPTAPTAEDALARVVRRHRLLRVTGGTAVGSTWVCACGETVRTPGVTRDWAETLHSRHAAAAVVAAIRAMTVEQQAELVNGEVERVDRPEWFDTGEPLSPTAAGLVRRDPAEPPQTRHDLRFVPSARVVGPWRAEP